LKLAEIIGSRVLRIGSDGEPVRAMQIALRDRGYLLRGTGYFGNATDTAVESFQRTHGLAVTGEVDAGVAAAIDAVKAQPKAAIPPEIVEEIGRPLWLQAALATIGTKEVPGSGDNPVILDWARQVGGNIEKEYTHDAIPWCALAVNFWLAKAGLKGTGTLWALDFAQWGDKLPGPAVGAIAPMKRNGGGHVPIVVGRDQSGNLMCVGGNQSDAVNIKPFDPARVVSFRWPKLVSRPHSTGFSGLPVVRSDGRLSTNER
jgi:uncharacterized protein (TIGR02594 family)